MTRLEQEIGAVLTAHPQPAVRALLLDCWRLGQRYGEAEGLAYLEMYRAAIENYERAQRALAHRGAWAAGGSAATTGTA